VDDFDIRKNLKRIGGRTPETIPLSRDTTKQEARTGEIAI
jgi:hypothetical protein